MRAVEQAELAALTPALLAAEPAALALMLHGSHARGDAGPFSDIDLRIFTATPPLQRDRERVAPCGGRLVHWSIGARTLAEKLAEIADPEVWPWAAAHYRDMQPLHDPHDLLRVLRAAVAAARPEPAAYAPPVGHALSDLLEYVAKLKNAEHAPPDPDVFDAAKRVARRCEIALRPFNPVGVFASEIELNAYFRTLPVAPPGWAADRAVCLGLSEAARPFQAVLNAALRLALGTLDLLCERADALALPADLDAALRGGALHTYVQQGVGAPVWPAAPAEARLPGTPGGTR